MEKVALDKDKLKTCIICKELIHLEVESYAKLTDYKEGKFYSEGYYHNRCFREQWKKAQEQTHLMKRVHLMLDKFGVENVVG